MAYAGGSLSLVIQTIEGSLGEYFYANPANDSNATIQGAGYFSDGASRGMGVGDIVNCLNPSTGVISPMSVSAVNATTGAATVVAIGSGKPATAFQQTVILPLQLLDIAAGTFKVAVPFAFKVLSALFRTAKPASTAAKAATLTVGIAGTPVTGGVMALTSANQNTIGGTVAATAITALNTGTAGQTLEVTASSVTPFIEGDGWVEFTVSNLDLLS